MSYYENLSIGQHVIFHDERQLEVAGTVKERQDCDGRICYLIEIDNGGFYNAKIRKNDSSGIRTG